MKEITEISGNLDRIIYKNEENGFSVFYLKINSKESVTINGYMPEANQGEHVTLKGTWTFHKKFGRQFSVKECKSQLPASADGIKKYLSSGLVKGIGPKYASYIVQCFGEKTLEIIDKEPQRLLEVKKIGQKRVGIITNAWSNQKEISKVMVFLKSKNVATAHAIKIFKIYGDKSIEKIQENPYRLVDDIWGIGFKTSDGIALNLGFKKNSLYRVQAGILYSISEATNNGHLYLELEKAKQNVIKILELEENEANELLKKSLRELYNQDKIKLIEHNDKHFITLPKFYFSEKGIAKKLKKLQQAKSKTSKLFDISKIYDQIRIPDNNICLNEKQQKGILTTLQNKITIITGGPGTGKTTLTRKLLDVLDWNKVKYKLAAPTGRATKRMFESTNRNTQTLHRLLEFSPAIMNFSRNESNALELEFLVIDEASMIDVFLMHSILKAMPLNSHLILLGDINQLPSVGAGNILNDLINSKKIAMVKLEEVFRQAQDSLIIVNAHKINKGEFPTNTATGKKDFFYKKIDEPEDIFPVLHKIYKSILPKFNISEKNVVVLTPMNRGICGTQRINKELQTLLNPRQDEQKQIMHFGQYYKVADRVMQIKNNYEKYVFNGDIGYIEDINKADQIIKINFGQRVVEYNFSELNELVLSYSISIHKSQGSEFDAVIIPIFMQHFVLLQRNLIYTAITRAKKLCILLGQAKAIAMGIKNNKTIKRNTFLQEFLTTDLESK